MNTNEKIEESYNEYLNFVEHLESLEFVKDMYHYIDKYLSSNYKGSPILIYSLKKNHNENEENGTLRCLWNKKKKDSSYSKEELDSFFKDIKESVKKASSFGHKSIDSNGFRIYSCEIGADEKQMFFLLYKLPIESDFTFDKRLQCTAFNCYQKLIKLEEAKKLKHLIYIDDVSNLYNQRKFIIDIENHVNRYEKMELPFCVIFIDIDHFKNVNDQYGHLAGTKLIKDVGGIIKSCLRDEDLCYRYGGDEFVALIPEGDIDTSRIISERILSKVKKEEYDVSIGGEHFKKDKVRLSVSIGIASFPEDAKSKLEIISYADKMMYMAKESGRGRVCLAGSVVSLDD